jgi:thioredoxin 1
MPCMSAHTVHLACLCAAWCRLCDDYAKVIEQVRRDPTWRDADLRWHWIDIEDQAEVVGDFDVETFPTWVIADARGVRFAGALEPQPDTLRRLLRAIVLQPGAAPAAAAPEAIGFAERLRQHDEPERPRD